MEYGKILSALKRISFEEKMRVAQIYSRQTFTCEGIVDADILRGIPAPWDLEVFVLFSVKSTEWKNDNFQDKNLKNFLEIIDCIRDKTPEFFKSIHGTELVTWILTVIASVQFDIQKFHFYRMFRFNYYFKFENDKINMPKLFKEKFGCDYYEYMLFGYILWLVFSEQGFVQDIFNAVVKNFAVPAAHLTLTREEYSEMLDGIASKHTDYLYCLRPSYSYPFINYGNTIYCPLPHLLTRATSSSLMHRLTDKDSDLMTLIGKEVYENYLFTIIKDSNIFDEVISEQIYYVHGKERKTVDVMAKRGDYYVFFDSKSFTPKINIRIFSQDALDKDIERLVDACVQMYKHIRNRFVNEYDKYFENQSIREDSIFGIVVLQENPYIRVSNIYEKAAEVLGISKDSNEYVWLYTHIGISSIDGIENYCFTGADMLNRFQAICNEKSITQDWLTGNIDCNHSKLHEPYNNFIKTAKANMKQILENL